jgi:hypothetical protein
MQKCKNEKMQKCKNAKLQNFKISKFQNFVNQKCQVKIIFLNKTFFFFHWDTTRRTIYKKSVDDRH